MSQDVFGYVGINQESSFGAGSGLAPFLGEVSEDTISMDNNIVQPQVVNKSRIKRDALPGNISASGVINTDLSPEIISPWILKGLFGTCSSSTSGAGVYEHIFSIMDSSPLPSFCIRSGYRDLSQTWFGCSFSSATITAAPGGDIALSANVLAQRPEESPEMPAPPSFAGPVPFSWSGASFFFDGAPDARFESFSVSINNSITPVYSLNANRYALSHSAGALSISGSFTLEFETEKERRDLWGATISTGPKKTLRPLHLSLMLTHQDEITQDENYYFKLDLPEIFIKSAPAGIHRTSERILQRINFTAAFSRAHDKIADIVLRNSTVSYPNP